MPVAVALSDSRTHDNCNYLRPKPSKIIAFLPVHINLGHNLSWVTFSTTGHSSSTIDPSSSFWHSFVGITSSPTP